MTFVIKHEKFEGPLDLLLDLIENEKLAISEISLAKVTDEYLLRIKALEKKDPEEMAEFLVVAAQLMLIKSKSLLPHLALEKEEEASIAELEARLAEYQRYRAFARELKQLEGERRLIFAREAYQNFDPFFYPPPSLALETVRNVFAAFIKSLPKLEKLAEEKIRRIVSLEEKMNSIRSFLSGAVERAFSEVVKGARERVEVIVSFLAVLELARQKFLDLGQEKTFGEITIKRL